MKYDFLVVGAGFAGSVMAERIAAQLDKKVLLVEKRPHIGGNAYDELDEYGILVHRYGPHIFHTNSKEVFDYLSMFTEWNPYEHKVLAFYKNEYYPMPINRITINKLYNLNLESEKDVEEYLSAVREDRSPVLNSEDIIINRVGWDLFDIFFKNYTFKQWHKYPDELASTVCGRIPVRTNDDCRYFTDKYQFIPKYGYTKMFEKMLSHKNIEVLLNTDYKTVINDISFDKMIYTGPIDYFFDFMYGKLPYRSIRIEFENYKTEKVQLAGVVNYTDESVQFTRVTEFKNITGQIADSTTLSKEYTQLEGEPYYPVPTDESRELAFFYKKEISRLKNILFCGRLAEYQYFNMDQVVASVFRKFEKINNKM